MVQTRMNRALACLLEPSVTFSLNGNPLPVSGTRLFQTAFGIPEGFNGVSSTRYNGETSS